MPPLFWRKNMLSLAGVLHVIDVVNEWAGRIFAFLSLVLMGIVIYDTVMRYVFTAPTIWGVELDKILLLTMVCLGGGYCLLHGGHVKVDILYQFFSPRVRAAMDLLTHLFLLVFCVAVIWYGGSVFWEAWEIGEVCSDSAWEYPLWPVLMLVPIAGILLGCQAVAKWIRDLSIVITGEDRLGSKVVKVRAD